jgi:hypothetical protein
LRQSFGSGLLFFLHWHENGTGDRLFSMFRYFEKVGKKNMFYDFRWLSMFHSCFFDDFSMFQYFEHKNMEKYGTKYWKKWKKYGIILTKDGNIILQDVEHCNMFHFHGPPDHPCFDKRRAECCRARPLVGFGQPVGGSLEVKYQVSDVSLSGRIEGRTLACWELGLTPHQLCRWASEKWGNVEWYKWIYIYMYYIR